MSIETTPKRVYPKNTPEGLSKAGVGRSALAGGVSRDRRGEVPDDERVLLEQLGEQIRNALAESSMTQRELAERLGFGSRHMGAIMSGQRNLNIRLLVKIGRILGYRFNVVASKIDS